MNAAVLLTAVLRGLGLAAPPFAILVVSDKRLVTAAVTAEALRPDGAAGLEVFTPAAVVADATIIPSP